MSQIDEKYTKLGGEKGFLGKPETAELTCPDGVGKYRHYKGGSIYWHPFTGVHEVHGLIRAKWAKLGWEKSFLGYPKTDESPSPVAGGRYNRFQGGSIHWFPSSKEAFETHGAIHSKWGSLNWESGFLGFPVTDETSTPDGVGRYNHFQHGSIYWKPSLGAHEVHGLIRGHWSKHGWEKNPELGYPISDELPTLPGGKNRYSDFENGVVHWKYGDKFAAPLVKLTLDGASKSADQVVAEIASFIKPLLLVDDRIYIKSEPFLNAVTDYYFDGNKVHNRRYEIQTQLGVNVPTLSDPWINIHMLIEIDYAKPGRAVIAFLSSWSYYVHVPAFTSTFVSAQDLGNQVENALKPQAGKLHVLKTIPDNINVLSVKVMPNGDLEVYIEPHL